MKKDIIILSVGPVPTQDNKIVEGGGLRAWGLANGLSQNDIKVTVAVPDSYKIEDQNINNINIVSWDFNNVIDLCNKYNTVCVLYSRADLMQFLTDNLDPKKVVIIDLYVPIYIESLARKVPRDINGVNNHLQNIKYWNSAFTRGDYFICANKNQHHLYTGLLSAFGRISPVSKVENILKEVPFGIYSTPIGNKAKLPAKYKKQNGDFVILWFGGIYPWFDIEPLLKTIKDLSDKNSQLKLYVVGGKNPFVKDEQFIKKYKDTVNLAKKMGLLDKNIFFKDWISYEDRESWYNTADIIINLHNPGSESMYAWRTRVVDFIWAGRPIISSGGDELSSMMEKKDAAYILKSNTEEEISKAILKVKDDKKYREKIINNLKEMQKSLYWENTTKELSRFINNPQIAKDRDFFLKNHINFSPLEKTHHNSKENRKYNQLSRAVFIYKSEGLKSLLKRTRNYLGKFF